MLSNFNKNSIDKYFKELAKLLCKTCKGYQFEIILVGGASVLLNYGFRDVTNDVDAIFVSSEDFNEAIKKVSDKFEISAQWLNSDVMKTKSYSDKIREVSSFYKTYNETVIVRTLKDEYLIAMKMVSGRIYKNDMSDIVGIISESKNAGLELTMKNVEKALIKMYGSKNVVNKDIMDFVEKLFTEVNIKGTYMMVKNDEKRIRQDLVDFECKYQISISERSIDDIVKMLKRYEKQ